MQDERASKGAATSAVLLWGVVAAGLTYGVVNTVKSVIDLFTG